MTTPQTVKDTIVWLQRLGRPALPNCPNEAATVGKEPKQPAYISGWKGKEPIVKPITWKHFQDSLPVKSQLQTWFKNPKVGISTLGGWNGKHWLGWIDFDVKTFTSQEECDRVIADWMNRFPILKEAPRFRTPSGGYRFLLAWESEPTEFKANSKFTLKPEGTLMGELLTKNGAHTILPPTIGVNGNHYYWEHFTEYPPVVSTPQDVGIFPVKPKRAERVFTKEATSRKQKSPDEHGWTDIDWARSFLAAIPNADLHYDDWLQVGMALQSVDDSLSADWIAWSQQSSKHVDGECERKWASFNPNGGVGIGTLAELAKQHGWTSPFKGQRNGHRQNSYKRDAAPKLQVPHDDPDADCSELGEWQRPLIQLDPGQLNSILSELESALSLGDAPRDAIYVQGSHDGFYLSRVLKASPDNRSQLIEISKDIDTLDLLTSESLQYELNRRFSFERYDARKEDYKPVDCPRTVASQFLQKGRWPQLPRLTGISYIPLLLKNGTVISQPGYHKPTGMLLQFDPDEFPAIPDKPTKEDAIAALTSLIDWLKEFPFLRSCSKERKVRRRGVITF